MMTLAMLVTSASLLTGQSCAAIDNTTNAASWHARGGRTVSTTYTDLDVIRYARPVPIGGATLRAIIHAQDGLGIGKPGPKMRLACSD